MCIRFLRVLCRGMPSVPAYFQKKRKHRDKKNIYRKLFVAFCKTVEEQNRQKTKKNILER